MTSLFRLAAAVLALVGAVALAPPPAHADKVVPMVSNGSATNRLDLVILGDGYRSTEFATFEADAGRFVEAFFGEEPFKTYAKYFNVVRVETVSKVSGAGNGSSKGTAFGAYFNCFNVERLLCIDEAKVSKTLSATTASNARDLVIVLVNDKRYGGSGGPYAVASTHELAGEVAIHEFGHSFGHLDDEYVDPFNCGRYTDPWGFNVTKATSRPNIPWTRWIARTTPIPTPEDVEVPGLFEGAYFCPTGWYRPTANSLMRYLGSDFGPVNGEQLIRRIYGVATILDRTLPKAGTVTVGKNGRFFRAVPIDAALPTLNVIWRLDGKRIGTGVRFKLDRALLAGKTRKLTVSVKDATPGVKKDSTGALVDTVTWTVKPG